MQLPTSSSAQNVHAVETGPKNSQVRSLGQVDFSASQVTFHAYMPDGKGHRQAICQLNHDFKTRDS